LLVGASRGRQVLAPELERMGAHVDRIVVYASSDVTEPDPAVRELLASRGIDWITVTSSASARSLARLYGDAIRSARIASISPVTSGVLANDCSKLLQDFFQKKRDGNGAEDRP